MLMLMRKRYPFSKINTEHNMSIFSFEMVDQSSKTDSFVLIE